MDNLEASETALFDEDKTITLTSTEGNNNVLTRNNMTSHILKTTGGEITLENITFDGEKIETTNTLIRIENSVFTMNENTIIQNNITTTDEAGGIALRYSTATINGGKIINNTAQAGGGGGLHSRHSDVVINDVEISEFADISREVALASDYKVRIKVQRNDDILPFDVTLTEIEMDQSDGTKVKKHMLGVKSVTTIETSNEMIPIYKSFIYALKEVTDVTVTTLRGLGQMISGERSSEDIGGIIRIAEMTGDISKNQGLLNYVVFLALLSVNLGLINLLPIPVLDGGHIIFYTIEIITRKPLNEKVKEYLFRIGFAILLALMVFATFNDIVHLFNRWFNS